MKNWISDGKYLMSIFVVSIVPGASHTTDAIKLEFFR